MKKFIIKSLIFLVPIVAVTCFFEWKLDKVANAYTVKRDYIETKGDSIELLITGNSQALFGINPACFRKKAFNVANTSQGIYYDVRIVLKYIHYMPNLKYVVIPVSYLALPSQTSDLEPWRDDYYYNSLGIKPPGDKFWNWEKHSKIMLYAPRRAFEYAMKRFNVRIESLSGFQPNGWAIFDTTPVALHKFSEEQAQKIMQPFNSLYVNDISLSSNCHDLDTLLTVMKSKNITPILVSLPTYPSFYHNMEHLDIYYKKVHALTNKFNCRFIDYINNPAFSRKDFYDFEHLNVIGAEKFSKMLDTDIFTAN